MQVSLENEFVIIEQMPPTLKVKASDSLVKAQREAEGQCVFNQFGEVVT